MKINHLILSLLCFLLLLVGCQRNVFYSDIQSIPGEKWAIDRPLSFTVNIEDSMQYYNMYIHLRNTTDFETQNFYVFMRTTYPDGHSEQDTLGFILCEMDRQRTRPHQGQQVPLPAESPFPLQRHLYLLHHPRDAGRRGERHQRFWNLSRVLSIVFDTAGISGLLFPLC